ncbi:3-oxoacyl-ACP reductase [Nitzschia inconspicua]|uniref:3-oxoacyl-ACP reductase n=1 Tax=Nitzschia inconspicua TaxID=303405 RepID=A0A9K3L2A1_9STRA|nr:3-oxoacyl-ACP reductase [Nitzschia inconspicua]
MTATLANVPPILNHLFSVSGKNVLITGGSRGIGLMIAKNFVQAGANVLLTSRSEEACKEAAQSIQSQYVASNVANREGCEALARHVAQVFDNRLDVLINNAGTSWGEPLDRKSGKANWGFDKVFDLNVKGMFYLTQACIPLLQNAATPDNPARVINVGSIVGLIPQSAPTHAYDASKAAVHSLTKKLAADLARKHITVNALAPGFVQTRMTQGLESWGATPEKVAQTIPLQRWGNEDDMTGACIYFSSRAGAWCTGVILNVDGGAVGAIQVQLDSKL